MSGVLGGFGRVLLFAFAPMVWAGILPFVLGGFGRFGIGACCVLGASLVPFAPPVAFSGFLVPFGGGLGPFGLGPSGAFWGLVGLPGAAVAALLASFGIEGPFGA